MILVGIVISEQAAVDTVRFEQGLSTLLRQTPHIFDHLALAELAGVSQRAHDWLRQRLDNEPGKKIRARWFGSKSFGEIVSLWEVLRRGAPVDILNSAHAAVPDQQDKIGVSLAFDSIIKPLVLLRRGPVVRALHAELPAPLGESFAENAALALGACGEWEDALGILERAHRDGASPHINMSGQSLLWKHAYLQGEVDTVMPQLAAIAFNRQLAHAAEARAWQLVAYQLRTGRTDIRVPALAKADQAPGYTAAAALQIAVLEGTPSAAKAVAELRPALAPTTTTIQFVDRGIAVQLTSDDLGSARIRIAARHRDYAKLSTLAQTPSRSPVPVSEIVIDALIEEGDWRGAAEFAERYDPRDQPVIEGFDDPRMHQYCELQLILAAAAARGGDDAAARTLLAEHVAALRSIREADQDQRDSEEDAAENVEAVEPGLRAATLLAGAAEGMIPRRFLAMLLPVFRGSY